VAAAVAAGLALRLYNLGTWSLTDDEGFAIHVARMPVAELLRFVSERDPHPPLYYLSLWAWIRLGLGDSEFSLRLLPVLLGVVTLLLVYYLSRSMLGHRVALAATFLLAFSPHHIRWTQEARMPSLVTLVSLLSLYALARLIETNRLRYWAAYGVAIAAGLYTLYSFALTILAYQLLAGLLWLGERRPDLRRWIVCHTLVSLAFVPWYLLAQRSMSGEQVGLTLSGIGGVVWVLHLFTSGPLPPATPFLKAAVLIVAAVAVGSVVWRPAQRHLITAALLIASLAPLIVASALMHRNAPLIVANRLLAAALIPWILLVALGLSQLGFRTLLGAAALVVSINVYSYAWMTQEYPYTAGWRSAAHYIADVAAPGAIVVGIPHWRPYVLELYFKQRRVQIDTFGYRDRRDMDELMRETKNASEIWLSFREWEESSYLRAELERTMKLNDFKDFGGRILLARYVRAQER
jgi:uncharacterized membrane protein